MLVPPNSRGRWFAILQPAALVELLLLKEAPTQTQELDGINIFSISLRRCSIAHIANRVI
jgi:hypothetical protein